MTKEERKRRREVIHESLTHYKAEVAKLEEELTSLDIIEVSLTRAEALTIVLAAGGDARYAADRKIKAALNGL